MRFFLVILLAVCSGACGFGGAERRELIERSKRKPESPLAMESRTLTNLALLQAAVEAYARVHSRPPGKLKAIVPKFLTGIPAVEGLSKHKPSNNARKYPLTALEYGAVNKGFIRDLGGWGYIPSDPPKVFVDCIHKSSRGLFWYAEHGKL